MLISNLSGWLGGWVVGWAVGLIGNITTSAPNWGLDLGLSLATNKSYKMKVINHKKNVK